MDADEHGWLLDFDEDSTSFFELSPVKNEPMDIKLEDCPSRHTHSLPTNDQRARTGVECGSDGVITCINAEDEGEEPDNTDILCRLEDVVHSVMSQMTDIIASSETRSMLGRKIAIELVDRRKSLRPDGTFCLRTITFPHRSRHASAKQLAQFLRVIDLIHEAVSSGIPTTKRDIYYKDVTLFGSQSVVDRLIDDVSATMDLSRAEMCVRASAKGMFCGSGLVIHLRDGGPVRGNDTEGCLIPPSEDIRRFEVNEQLSWVLVVEKEAVFQTLCHLRFASHPNLGGPGLIITGKGYPDVTTRQLVASLAQNLEPRIPILGVVDADPFGIDILSVYKYGSTSMSHQYGLDAPRLRWAGVMASELASLGIEKERLISITKHDEKKALSMLHRSHLPRKWRKEIQHMLFNRRKAEIEVLSASQTITDFSQSDISSAHRDCLLARYLTSKVLKAIRYPAGKA